MRSAHRRRRHRDQARYWHARGDSNGDCSAHRVARKNRTVRRNRAAREKFSHQSYATVYRTCGRKRARLTAMTRKVRCVNSKALLSKTLRQVAHDLLVGGDSVKEDDGPCRRAPRLFQNCRCQAATAGVDEIDLFVIRGGNRKPSSCGAEQDSGDGAEGVA